MYQCCKCKVQFPILHEAVLHNNYCLTRWNNMVYSNFRVAAHQQYRRHRLCKGIKRVKVPLIENFLIITKL